MVTSASWTSQTCTGTTVFNGGSVFTCNCGSGAFFVDVFSDTCGVKFLKIRVLVKFQQGFKVFDCKIIRENI